MEIPIHLWLDFNLCSANTPVGSKSILKVNWQIWAVEASVSLFKESYCPGKKSFVTVNDVDCDHIITVDLSLSGLSDCLSLSHCHFSINRNIVQVLQNPRIEPFLPDNSLFACSVHKAPEKVTLRGRCGNTHKCINTQFNHTLADRRPTLFVCNLQPFVPKEAEKVRLHDLWHNKSLQPTVIFPVCAIF